MVDRFLERVNAHGRGGSQSVCTTNCGQCCYDKGERCRNLGDEGCVLPVQERPVVCNLYLCPDRTASFKPGLVRPTGTNVAPFPPPPHRIRVREAMARWEEHRVHDVPAGCPPHSTFGSAYLTNLRDYGERSVWQMAPFSVFVVGGGPSFTYQRFLLAGMRMGPSLLLATRDNLWTIWEGWKRSGKGDDAKMFIVDGELDMLGCARDYPPGFDGGLIIDPCKLLDPRIPFNEVYFCRLPPMQREDTFIKPPWLGRELPYRTSGELALYIALYVLRAPVVGCLGIENEGLDRIREYDNARYLLEGGHSSEVVDYSGRGVVADYLEGKK